MIIPTPGRRLAVIDSNFPWKQSGFRYWENYEIYRQRPDTLFFATSPYIDPWGQQMPNDFPAPVQPVSQLVPMIISEDITDIYCVFLNIAVSLVGRNRLPNGQAILGSTPDLNILPIIKDRNIKLHTTLYPGGGLQPDTPVKKTNLTDYYSTIFTNIQEVLAAYPSSIYVPGMINTEFYAQQPKPVTPPIKIVFAAHQGIRKNFPHLIEAFNQLDDSFHLHIIGNWQDYLHLITNPNYTFHNLLNPDQAARIYQQCHVFVSCSTTDWTATDGFPTTAAGDAMATGCLLVSSNPRNDRYTLVSGVDYMEITENQRLIDILWWIKHNFQTAMAVAASGTHKIRTMYDSRLIVNRKLYAMGLVQNIDPVRSEERRATEPEVQSDVHPDDPNTDHVTTKKKIWDVLNWKKIYEKWQRHD
jgi:glycosyltransferase involved in cell wall biosynthesis